VFLQIGGALSLFKETTNGYKGWVYGPFISGPKKIKELIKEPTLNH
jgi:hypothetical protein